MASTTQKTPNPPTATKKIEGTETLSLNELWLWERPSYILAFISETPSAEHMSPQMILDHRLNGAISKWRSAATPNGQWTYLPIFRDERARHLLIFGMAGKGDRVESADIDKVRQTLLKLKVNEIALVCSDPKMEGQMGRDLRRALKGVSVFETKPF